MTLKKVYLFILVMTIISCYAQAPDEGPKINLLVSEKPRTILLQWKNPPLKKINGIIAGYKVNYRVKGQNNWISLDVLKIDDNHHSMTITGEDNRPLQAWKYYQVYVTLFNQKYNASSNIEEVVVVGNGPGAAPNNFVATDITENNLILKWDSIPRAYLPSQETFLGYKIFYNEENGKQRTYNNELTKNTKIKIKDLKPVTKYFFSISGVTNVIVGPVSPQLEVTTAPVLPPPVIEKHESRAPNTFYLEWKFDKSVTSVTRLLLRYKKKEFIDTWSTVELGSKKNVTIKNLLPWQQYDVKIDLESEGRKSSSSLIPILVSGKVPGRAPTNVNIIDFKYTYIKLSWDEIDPRWIHGKLVNYAIKYKVDGTSIIDMNYTKYRNITINNLQPDTAYQFQIAGQTQYGIGLYSDPKIEKTKKLADPGIPQDVYAQNANPTKVKIRCRVMGDVSMFVVGLRDVNTGIAESVEYHMQTVQKVSLHEYSLVVTVKAFTQYQIQLKSCILDKCSIFSNAKVIRTMEDIPTEVRDVRITKSNINDPTVTWKQPALVPGVLRHYLLDVKYLDDISVDNYPIEISNKTLKYTLVGLPPFSELKLVINAVTIGSGPGTVIPFKSPEGLPGEPRDIWVILSKDYQMSIKWKKPERTNGNIIGYKIYYEGTKYYRQNFMVNKSLEVSADVLQPFRIKDLIPGTTYKVEISAKTVKGYGEPGKAKREIMTSVKAPEAPKPPILASDVVTSATVTVYLQRAVQQYGPISSYQLIMEEEIFPSDTVVSRKRRSVDLPDNINGYSTSVDNDEKYYITAVVSSQRVPGRFVVGNDKDYNYYRNHPLKSETKYTLHVRAVTQDNKRSYYGEAASISLPTTLAVKEIWNESSIPIPVIIGVAGGILVLIVVVVIFVKYKRAARSKKEANPYDLRLYPVVTTAEEAEEMLPAPPADSYPSNPDHPAVSAAQFPKHVAKLHRNENAGFKAEYPQLKIGKESPWDVAHLLENKPKNRYANIVAYDHSRVKLSRIHDVPGSDYINASYIDGYRKPNAYVSTQGPLPSTYNDFWRMVWEIRSCSIVMLTNLQEKNKLKCHKYWPDDSTDYGDIKVTLLRNDPYADFTIRTFKLEEVGKQMDSNGGVYQVRQFHFMNWPDHGVPQYPTSLLNFRRIVRSFDEPHAGPTIVHCSAGVGRTGAYIAVDSMLQRIQKQNDVDIFNFIASMRMRRIAMVQTEDQYIFVHDAIVEALLNGNTEISVHELREAIKTLDQIDSVSKVSGFEMQWKTLNHSNVTMHKSDVAIGMQGENVNKNRYSTVLPTESSRVLLLPIDENEASTYINAVYVDSYKQKNAFILTQSPLPRTVFDFWRMVSEHGTTSIVMLNAVDEGDDYAKFWPDSGRRDYDMITVECLPDSSVDDLDITANNFLKPVYRTPPTELVSSCLQITDKRNPTKSFTAKLFHYIGWTETRVPNTYRPVISLLSQIERWQQQSGRGPITIMCSDGIGRSGTLAAIIYVLERVKLHQVFDCFQAVKAMRIQRPHVVKYMDQFKYIHFTVQEYLSAFEEHTKL